jgi:hypothetical protein
MTTTKKTLTEAMIRNRIDRADLRRPAKPALVNHALATLGLDAKLYRSPAGYYYWSGNDAWGWPSIYSYRISDYLLIEVLDEARLNSTR